MSLLLFFGFSLYAQPRVVGEPRVLVVMQGEPAQTPVWSPDGAKLFLNNGTMEVSVDGTDLRRAVAPVSNLRRMELVANPLLQQMISDPMNVASQVQGLQPLSGQMIFNPVLSPQGDRIVFQAGYSGMYVINVDGSGFHKISSQAERATWTADGKYVVAMKTEDDGRFFTKGELKSIDVSNGNESVLFSSERFITLSPAISPDGKQLVFADFISGAIYIMDIQ